MFRIHYLHSLALLFSAVAICAQPGYKAVQVQAVFDQLVEARGDWGLPKPGLVFVPGKEVLAYSSQGQIFLGEKAYDLSRKMGADSLNALAGLLAHELIHYYEGHGWEEDFSRNFAGSAVARSVEDSWIKDEVQADLWGGLLAHSAGFQTAPVMPEFLPMLYRAYERNPDVPGYPHLRERILIAEKTAGKLADLVDLFATANYLVALGMYEDAAAYYELILKEGYRSRELYNNMGVYLALAALPLYKAGDLPFVLPIELDVTTRLRRQAKSTGQQDPARCVELLQESLEWLERAKSLDEKYGPAVLNMGCVYLLMGLAKGTQHPEAEDHFLQAEIFARKALRMPTGTHRSNARILKGLIAQAWGDTTGAASFFQAALEHPNPVADINLRLLRGEEHPFLGEMLEHIPAKEPMAGLDLSAYTRRMRFDTFFFFRARSQRSQWGRYQWKDTRLLAHFVDANHLMVVQEGTTGMEQVTQLGIAAGASTKDILAVYKAPDRVVCLTGETWLVYEAPGLIFRLNDRQVLRRWCVFRKKMPIR